MTDHWKWPMWLGLAVWKEALEKRWSLPRREKWMPDSYIIKIFLEDLDDSRPKFTVGKMGGISK